MIATLALTLIAALLVYRAGRQDVARDPRLTIALLTSLTIFPLLAIALPKVEVLPSTATVHDGASSPWIHWLIGFWLTGMLWQLARLLMAQRQVRQWHRHSHEIKSFGAVSLRLCTGITSPIAVGIIHPLILVPGTWHTWSTSQQQAVLAHELAHHRRRDPLWRLLAALACAVHWYHPLVHWMARRFVIQSEFACDAAALNAGIPAKIYAHTLCDLAERMTPSPLTASMAGEHALESRIRRIATSAAPPKVAAVHIAVAILSLTAALAAATLDRKQTSPISPGEIQLRLTANPFPGN